MLNKKRLLYLALFLGFTIVEVLIAIYVHDQVIRPFVGDILVVMVLYCLVRCVFPARIRMLPLYLFLFATGVELLQLLRLTTVLGLQHNRFATILLGSTFDLVDIFCYGVGCVLLAVFEFTILHHCKKTNVSSL